MRKLKLTELGRSDITTFKSSDKHPIVVVLDNIRSGMNVGAFFRTSDAFALEHIILCGITPVPPHKEVHKAAIGATLSMDYSHNPSVINAINQLRTDGYTIIGIEQTDHSVHLNDLEWPQGKIAIVFGNEVEGISQEVLSLLDQAVDIKQYGTKHSLNVAVCGGIVLWAAINH